MTSQWCLETSAAPIVGQNHARPLLDIIALKRRTIASAPPPQPPRELLVDKPV
jgi:hypothetical protein